MPLLTLTKDGEIYEVDARLDGAQGMGRAPELVEADDVTALSLVENDKVLKDRAAVRKLQMMSHMNKVKRYAEHAGKKAAQEVLRQKIAEKRFENEKKKAYLASLYKNQSYLTARQQGGLPEKMSGVTGYGFTSDGRRPVGSQASLDWNPILQANTAFGGHDEHWGADTGLGQNPDWEAFSWRDEKSGEVEKYVTPNMGMMDQKDVFTLEQFDDANYSVPWYTQRKSGEFSELDQRGSGPFVVNKSRLDYENNRNMQFVGGSKMAEYARNGWGWSMYETPEGKIVVLKVAYHYGLPMIDPFNEENVNYRNLRYLLNLRGALYNCPPYYFKNEYAIRNGNLFTALAPAIVAAHKEYNTRLAELGPTYDPEGYKLQYSVVGPRKSAGASAGGGSIFQNLFKALFGETKANYQHPFLKQKLLVSKK